MCEQNLQRTVRLDRLRQSTFDAKSESNQSHVDQAGCPRSRLLDLGLLLRFEVEGYDDLRDYCI